MTQLTFFEELEINRILLLDGIIKYDYFYDFIYNYFENTDLKEIPDVVFDLLSSSKLPENISLIIKEFIFIKKIKLDNSRIKKGILSHLYNNYLNKNLDFEYVVCYLDKIKDKIYNYNLDDEYAIIIHISDALYLYEDGIYGTIEEVIELFITFMEQYSK